MIPYGVHIVSARHPQTGEVAAATVSWVTQVSFTPTLVVAALKVGTPLYLCTRAAGRYVVHMLGRDDGAEALTFARPVRYDGETLSGYSMRWAHNGSPLLDNAVAAIECHLVGVLEYGDHHTFVGEVMDAHVRLPPHERPDEMMLHLRELGATYFYGG